jgi:hypothetical protein
VPQRRRSLPFSEPICRELPFLPLMLRHIPQLPLIVQDPLGAPPIAVPSCHCCAAVLPPVTSAPTSPSSSTVSWPSNGCLAGAPCLGEPPCALVLELRPPMAARRPRRATVEQRSRAGAAPCWADPMACWVRRARPCELSWLGRAGWYCHAGWAVFPVSSPSALTNFNSFSETI